MSWVSVSWGVAPGWDGSGPSALKAAPLALNVAPLVLPIAPVALTPPFVIRNSSFVICPSHAFTTRSASGRSFA
jgi:hypothetical protein